MKKLGLTVLIPGEEEAGQKAATVAQPSEAVAGTCSVLQHLSGVLWNNESMSDVTLRALGREFHLHKLLVLQSPKLKSDVENWGEGGKVVIEWDDLDPLVTEDGLEAALGSLYGRTPCFDSAGVNSILAAGCYLELDALCRTCAEEIVSRVTPETFLDTFEFANAWTCGGEWAKTIDMFCWKYLFRTACRELRFILPELSCEQLQKLFTADELWVPTEVDRFRLVMEVLSPKLQQARDALSAAVVGDVINGVIDQVSASAGNQSPMQPSPTHSPGRQQVAWGWPQDPGTDANKVGVKRLYGIGEEPGAKKHCYFELNKWDTMSSGAKSAMSTSTTLIDGTDLALSEYSDDHSDAAGLRRQLTMSFELNGLQLSVCSSDPASVEGGALGEAARVQKLMEGVLTGEEGVMYGSMGFGDLLGVRGKLLEAKLESADKALQDGLWSRELLRSLITFHAFRESQLQPNDSLHNAGDLRVLAMNFKTQHAWVFENTVSLPRLRFGVEFENVESLARKVKSDMRSDQIFFAGSLYRVVLTMHVDHETRERTLGIFLQRSTDLHNATYVDASGFVDPRQEIDAQINFIAGTGHLEMIQLSGRISPPHNNKGYSRFLPFSKIKQYLTPSGTLRVTVIITLLFESVDVRSPIYVKAG